MSARPAVMTYNSNLKTFYAVIDYFESFRPCDVGLQLTKQKTEQPTDTPIFYFASRELDILTSVIRFL